MSIRHYCSVRVTTARLVLLWQVGLWGAAAISFWVKHYPALRKQLMRRYPKHPWPEDPTQLIAGDE